MFILEIRKYNAKKNQKVQKQKKKSSFLRKEPYVVPQLEVVIIENILELFCQYECLIKRNFYSFVEFLVNFIFFPFSTILSVLSSGTVLFIKYGIAFYNLILFTYFNFSPQSPIQSVTFRHILSISSFLEFLPVLSLTQKMNNALSQASLALFLGQLYLERGLKWQKVQLVWHVTSDSNLSLEDFNTLKKYCHLDVPISTYTQKANKNQKLVTQVQGPQCIRSHKQINFLSLFGLINLLHV